MRVPHRAVTVAALLVPFALAGCGPDTSPVPEQAADRYVCAGVPHEAMSLIIGDDELHVRFDEGSWDLERSLSCGVGSARDGEDDGRRDPEVAVFRSYLPWSGYLADEDAWREDRARRAGSTPVDADVPGWGYTYPDGDARWMSGWMCESGSELQVMVRRSHGARDGAEDAERLLRSMLPWHCGDQEAPRRTE
ncbi:hypothetical protein [Cellulomonas bogoriensis]|uniref:DUF3558 domain-containing protein n=1 Tax=Cellulomonas bogoriensis 69B4 = DSM 16987 TaxID=1386082 RepID=A0A0A0BQZ0_9CELL|nr:hypothetical protein [Cellulomonas bogoriensis]KGM09519.1 hypothetical protein N869_02065 [Cellulomonas bogoriensis 69B4 = DSM 16987]